MPIRLPQDAHGYDYEDQICAFLLAHGYYLETRLILKKGAEEVLEFDAIATPVKDHKDRRVVEVKSGKWGIGDVFKLFGQVQYTTEPHGWLIHKKAASDSKKGAIEEVTSQIPITTLNINIDSHEKDDSGKVPEGCEIIPDLAQRVFLTSWWARSAERIAQSKYKSWYKGFVEKPRPVEVAQDYLESINDCLFKPSPIARVDALYDAYKSAPQLTSNLISHVVDTSRESIRQVRLSVNDKHGRAYLQYVMGQEYRARISIIKNAYDAIIEETEEKAAKSEDFTWDEIVKGLLPESFRNGMEALRKFPVPENIPFFFQVFVEVFGGFYCPDDEREVSYLSSATGVDEKLIPSALNLLDEFFPINNGWVHQGDGVHFLKAVPAYLRGAGCFTRRGLYGDDWESEFPKLKWQISNWHNALYKLLEPSLKVED